MRLAIAKLENDVPTTSIGTPTRRSRRTNAVRSAGCRPKRRLQRQVTLMCLAVSSGCTSAYRLELGYRLPDRNPYRFWGTAIADRLPKTSATTTTKALSSGPQAGVRLRRVWRQGLSVRLT